MGTEGVIGAICGINAVEGVAQIALLQRIKACQIGESCLVGAKSTKVDAHRISKALLEKPNAETAETPPNSSLRRVSSR